MKLFLKRIRIFPILIVLILTLTIATAALAAGIVWEPVGPAGFSADVVEHTSLALGSSDTPYVAYRDWGNLGKATVMKFNGTSWEPVGSAGFSAGDAFYTSLALDSSDTPYVAYQDAANSNKATVMRFNGTSWETVGSAGFSAGEAHYTSLALDRSDTPYVAFRNDFNSGKATVMKFNGTSWEPIGSAGFSAGPAYFTSLALDSSDTPYVAYMDYANSNKATVMKFNGTDWEPVGSVGFSAETAYYTSLALDSSDTPYVAYMDYANSYKATVMKFNGTDWETVGSAGFSAGRATYTSLALDSSDTPYVAYMDTANSNKATVMKFNGTDWETVGSAGFSAGYADFPSLALDSSDTPYVAYQDTFNSRKATVMTIFPSVMFGANTNPTEGAVLTDGPTTITVDFNKDVLGDGSTEAANHVNNYLLFNDGGDGFDTVDCAGGVQSNDLNIPINTVQYDNNGGNGPFIATLNINNGAPLPPGKYRLLICGTTSIQTSSGLTLNNGADSELNFTIQAEPTILPATGFTPGMVTQLAAQPIEKGYSAYNELKLDIPKLGIEMPIVGVPQVDGDWDVSWLGSTAGWLEGTAFPTRPGNTVITGHVWDAYNNPGQFRNLRWLRYGDQFSISIGDLTYTYEVRRSYQVYANDLSPMEHADGDIVTLLTCEGYNVTKDSYLYRRVIQAVLVDVR